jgi:AmiR/NasT family two-component response regulator
VDTGEDLERKVETLQEALETRTVIGQAQGILMERLGLSAEEAFGYLRRRSNTDNVKLRDLAAEIVRTRCLLPEENGYPDFFGPDRRL